MANYSEVNALQREARRRRVTGKRSYRILATISERMDRYYIDPILGLIPGGWGDTLSVLMTIPFIWFSMFVVRSIPLTVAIIYNVLRDVAVGLIPFFVGDILDVLNRSYMKNMKLIQGFVNNDAEMIREVNRKMWLSLGFIAVFIVIIALLIKLTVMLIEMISGIF